MPAHPRAALASSQHAAVLGMQGQLLTKASLTEHMEAARRQQQACSASGRPTVLMIKTSDPKQNPISTKEKPRRNQTP